MANGSGKMDKKVDDQRKCCKTCSYFLVLIREFGSSSTGYGECRRHAPVLYPGDGSTVFPKLYDSKWCGEWEAKNER